MTEANATQAEPVEVHEAELPEATDTGIRGSGGQIDILLEAPVRISAEIGSVQMEVRELLKVAAGTVLKLDSQVGQPLRLYLRGVCFAKGDLVVIGEQLGVRITEILSPAAAMSAVG